MSALHRRVLQRPPAGRAPASVSAARNKLAPFGPGRRKDYTPVSWHEYFHRYEDVVTDSGTFRVYLSPEPSDPKQPRIVTLHGGGYSGLSWALFTQELTGMIHCQVVCVDLRGHGETHCADDDNLAGDVLVNDVKEVIYKLFGPEPPPIVLVGHSMGGAVAVRVAALPELEHCIEGLAVIDVVEGTAMESLASMQSFLRSRPTHFKSIEHAIEWCVRSGQVRNVDSAKVSMPGQIVNCETNRLATNELEDYKPATPTEENTTAPSRWEPLVATNSIAEEDDSEQSASGIELVTPEFKPPGELSCDEKRGDHRYKWRIDLSKTEKYWSGWFEGLSPAFLSVRAPRLLLLASIDGLDRELTVGQMQGKFQMQVLTRCGHAVHEDSPTEVARVVAAFALRYRLTTPTEDGEHMNLSSMPGC